MQPVLGPLTPAHVPQAFPGSSGAAALAIALTALDPGREPWRELEPALYEAATGEPAPEDPAQARELMPRELALAALCEGMHVRLVAKSSGVPMAGHLASQGLAEQAAAQAHERASKAAQAAGLVAAQAEPTEDHVRRGLEAGHPLLLLIDGAVRHDELDPRPHWLTLVGLHEEMLVLHDPLNQGGPEEGLLSRLPAVQGYQGAYALIEVGHGLRLR